MTQAEKFQKDPRIQQAKKLIQEALAEHQKPVDKLQGPESPEAHENYKKMIEEFSEKRGGSLFYDYIGSGFGSGPFVELADGSTKYDFITGIGVHYFGHSHPGLMNALIDGATSNTVMQGNLQQNVDSERLVSLLLEQANINGAGFDHCFLTSSGVMANENALKMIFQKRSPAGRVIAFEKCFHGRTMSVAAITDKAKYREGLPENLKVDYIPFYDYKDHEGSIKRSTEALENLIKKHPGEYAVLMCELIQGENGSWPGHTDFFKSLFEVCKKNNISIIDDEVQSFGRTENLYAFQYFGLDKDIDMVCIGKMSQACATLYREDHKPQAGLISQTFTSSSTAINASYFIINEMVNNNFLGKNGKINKLHNHFAKRLEEVHQKHPEKLEGPYGIGAMIAMTLFKGDLEKSKKFTMKLFDNGVTSFIAGVSPVRVRMLVPMGALEEKHIDEVVQIIEKTLGEIE